MNSQFPNLAAYSQQSTHRTKNYHRSHSLEFFELSFYKKVAREYVKQMLSFDAVGRPKDITVLPVEVPQEVFYEYERTVEQMKKQKEIDGVLDRGSFLVRHRTGVLSIHVQNRDMSRPTSQGGSASVFWEEFIYPDWSAEFFKAARKSLLISAPLEIQDLQQDKGVEDLPAIPIRITEKRKSHEF